MSSDEEEEPKEKQIGDYLLNEELGSGGFGKVVLGTHIPTGEKVAIKIMNKEQILSDELNKERVLNEISILKTVRHNNIVKLYEVMETPQKIYLVMEYCDNGEMFDYIVSKKHLTEKQACVFFQEIIDALTYLHSQNIAHRDVKPENILLQTFGNTLTTKLIDFGISRTYTLDKLISTPCGTASYAPPEMHKGEEYYGLLSDVWSAGVLLYAMVFGYLPFCEEDEDENIDNIINGNYEIPEEASPELEDLIKHIMDIDPLTRYDLDQIKKHPWYNLVTPPKCYPGLIVGYHKIPVDERILKLCEGYGFSQEEVEKSVRENKYDNKSSIYYIILSKMKSEGYESISDLYSKEYLDYINDKNNIIEKKEENKDEENKEVKQKELDLLNDVLKSEKEENEKEEKDENNINNLEQISSENKDIKNKNESKDKDEISVASENSKNIKEKEEDISEKNKNNEIEVNNDLHNENKSKNNSANSLNKENTEENNKIEIVIEEKEKEKNNEINENKEIKPTVEEIVKENKEIVKDNKEKENIIQISEPEKKDNKEPLITLSEKIQPEKDININETNKNKITEKKETNAKAKVNKNKNNNVIPKHSFFINVNTKRLLLQELKQDEYNSEKLNSSFTQKLTDSLKENVFKMRNPKAKIANKEKEINKALKEIKQNKRGKQNQNIQKKENASKSNKNKKIYNEPLFKGNKKKDHTIIHNRNASAVTNERRKNNKIEQTEKNNNNKTKIKNNKNISSSVEKTNKNNIHNKNADLKNNIKKIKIPEVKDKNKDKNKSNRENSTEKKTSKKYNKFVNKNVNNSTTIKKKENNRKASGQEMMTISNRKHNRIKSLLNSSTNKNDNLKTPSKNLNNYYNEPFIKRLNNSNISRKEKENHNLSHAGKLNKALELSGVKETNRHNKLSNIKASNNNYKKNIRLTYKSIEKEDFIKNDKTESNTQRKVPFKYSKVRSDINLSFDKNNISKNKNDKSITKKRNHNKSNSIEVNGKSKANKYINGFNRNEKENLYKKNLKYHALLKTDKNENKFKKYINLSSFEGRLKTEINNEKNGNQKFWAQKQEEQIIKECYYKGPIDLKNIFFGNSIDEIQEILVGIFIKNRIKYWKMNAFRFYCKKNGESFVIRIYILQDKIKMNNSNGIANKNKEETKISEFDINKKNENDDIKINNENKSENKKDKCMIFYICVLSKESNNKAQAIKLNKIINKKLSEIFK